MIALVLLLQDPLKAEPTADAERGRVLEWKTHKGQPYRYRLPAKIDAAKPPNLVIMLHGDGCRYYWPFANYPIEKRTFRGGDIVVGPEAVTSAGGDTFVFAQRKEEGEHLAALIDQFKKRFPIGKVFVYGHSSGAIFAYWFAGHRAARAIDAEQAKRFREAHPDWFD